MAISILINIKLGLNQASTTRLNIDLHQSPKMQIMGVILKKLRKDKLRFIIRAAEKRATRNSRKASKGKRRSTNTAIARSTDTTRIIAPGKIDIYSPKAAVQFLQFLNHFRIKARYNKSIQICFRNTSRITAAACLLLYAETDRLLRHLPGLKISCTLPPMSPGGKHNNQEYIVESALKQIGFFTLIGQRTRQIRNYSSVAFWRQLSGSMADGSLTASLFNSLPKELNAYARSKLYRGTFEAMANCVEHAHPAPRKDGLNIQDKRWWMFVGIKDDSLAILVCDLGVRIPNTIRNHDKDVLSRIASTIGLKNDTDADLIHASTFVKRTRTELGHRGKGGPDLRSIVETFPSALLSIRSNMGRYVLKGKDHRSKAHRNEKQNYIAGTDKREWKSNISESILGTIVEWNLSIKDMKK